jgi:hypothetical protein
MAVTEQARLALRSAARAALGDEEGDTLMAITAPSNTDLATRQDLEQFQDSIHSRITLEISGLRGEMLSSIAELRGEMLSSIAELRGEMIRGDGELRTEMVRGDGELGRLIERSANRSIRWMVATVFLAQGGTIGFITLMLR